MKGLLLTVGSLTAVMALAVGVESAPAANHAPAVGAKVALASSPLGRVLVDGRGRTLYLFEKDVRGKSSCAGKCAAFWPPLITTGKPHATAGAKTPLLGTTRRADGRLQVTYNHHPLYTFVKDTKKGQANGEGITIFGAEWDAVSGAGAKIEKNAAGSSTTEPAPGGYGYWDTAER